MSANAARVGSERWEDCMRPAIAKQSTIMVTLSGVQYLLWELGE